MTCKEEIKLLKEEISQIKLKLASLGKQSSCAHQWYGVPGVCRCGARREFTNEEIASTEQSSRMFLSSISKQIGS